ncbi:MAG: glycosyltransferase [Candidatus Magasanikbacteria bacterium]|nr:glycosyltransferase [Candidatus Magasanikbacteria bacterium]
MKEKRGASKKERGELFAVSSADTSRNFKKDQVVAYTSSKNDRLECVVVGQSEDANPGLILKDIKTGREFAVSADAVEERVDVFTVTSGTFKKGQQVEYTPFKGGRLHCVVVGQSEDANPGLILKDTASGRTFAVTAESVITRVNREEASGESDSARERESATKEFREKFEILEKKIEQRQQILDHEIEELQKIIEELRNLESLVSDEGDHKADLLQSLVDNLKIELEALKNKKENLTLEPEKIKPVKSKELPPVEPAESKIIPEETRDILPPTETVFVIDVSEIAKRLAWTQAEEKLNEYLNRWKSQKKETAPAPQEAPSGFLGKFWKKTKETAKAVGGTLKDIATHPKEFVASTLVRLSERGYLQKFYHEALAQIQSDKNLLAEIEARMRKSKGKDVMPETLEKHFEILDHVIEQYVEGVASEEEKGEQVTDADVNQEVANVLYEFAIGNLKSRKDVERYVELQVTPLLKRKGLRFHGTGEDQGKAEGLMYASNLFDVAEKYKGYVNSQIEKYVAEYGSENRDAIKGHVKGLLALDVQLGLKERDIRETKPESVKTWGDRVVDRLQSIPVLGKVLASPTAVGAGAGAAIGLAMKGAVRAPLRAIVAAPVVGALLGGFMGAMRRGRDLQYDRGLELRREALGQQAGGGRSRQVREFSHSIRSLDEVNARLKTLVEKNPDEEMSREDQLFLAEIFGRLEVERTTNTDQFGSGATEGKEYGTRIQSMTQLKLLLKRLTAMHPEYGADALWVESNTVYNSLVEDVEKKDEEFRKFRKKEMLKAAAFGATAGLAAGAVADAVIMAARGEFGESAVGRLGEWMAGNSEEVDTPVVGLTEVVIPGTEAHARIPANAVFEKNGDTLSLVDKKTGEVLAANLSVDENGVFSKDTIEQLRTKGWGISEHVQLVEKKYFEEELRQISIPEIPHATITLPESLDLAPSLVGDGFDIVESGDGSVLVSGITFLPNGDITAASKELLKDLGWNPEATVTEKTIALTNHNETLAELRKRFSAGVTPPEKRVWHGNMESRAWNDEKREFEVTSTKNEFFKDKLVPDAGSPHPYEYTADQAAVFSSKIANEIGVPDSPIELGDKIKGTLFDGKELRGQTAYNAKTGELTFDGSRAIKDMIRGGAINWDGTLDHRFHHLSSLIKSGKIAEVAPKFCYRLYLNDEDFKAGRAFSIPLGEDGKIHITDPEMVEFLVDKETGKPRFTAEIAYQDSKHDVARVLATKRRTGVMPELSATEERVGHHWEPVPPTSEPVGPLYDIQAPSEVVPDDHFFVPLPFVGRKAMEKGTHRAKEGRYGEGYGYGGNDEGGWRNRREDQSYYSSTIKENPHAQLNERNEINGYLERLDPEYKKTVDELALDFGSIEKDCRISVCIPSYKEGKRIYDSLKTYVNQQKRDGGELDPQTFEVLILDNHPESVSRDTTHEEVERFKKEFPDIRVRYAHRSFEKKMPIGYYRKIISDAALSRMRENSEDSKGHLLVSHDADRYGLAPTYFDQVLNEFDKNRELDAFGGMNDYVKEAYDKLPMMHAARRLRQIIDLTIQTKNQRIPALGGANSGFRAETYAAVGGYNPKSILGEDLEMGHILRAARDWDPKCVKFIRKAEVINDPRRGMVTMSGGKALISEYGDWVENEEVRGKTWTELLQEDTEWGEFDVKKLTKEAQTIFNYYVQWQSAESLRRVFKSSAKVLGIELAFDRKGTISVTNTKQLEKGMKEYRGKTKNTLRTLPKDAPKTVKTLKPKKSKS